MPLIDEHLVDDERLAALSRDAALFYLLLRLKIDDYGRFHAKPELLNSKLFPLRRDIRHTDITRWTAECRTAGMLRCYVDKRGRAILEVFDAVQRKKFMRSEFDPPEDQQNFLIPPTKEVEVGGKRRADHPLIKNKTGNNNSTDGHEISSAPPKCEPAHNGVARGTGKPELWKLLKDEKELTTRIRQERESTAPDRPLIESLKLKRMAIRKQLALPETR